MVLHPGDIFFFKRELTLVDGLDQRSFCWINAGESFTVIRLFSIDRPDCAGGYVTGVTSTGKVGVVLVSHLINSLYENAPLE